MTTGIPPVLGMFFLPFTWIYEEFMICMGLVSEVGS